MSFSHQISKQVYSNTLNLSKSESLTGDGEVAISQPIDASAVNTEILVAIDVSQLQAIAILSDTNCTIKTNDSAAPTDTIAITANVPYIWTINSYDACLITADVSKIFVTNGAAAEQSFQLLALTQSP